MSFRTWNRLVTKRSPWLAPLLKDHGQKFWSGQTWHMDVTDHTGLVLFRLDFTAALSPATQAESAWRLFDNASFTSS